MVFPRPLYLIGIQGLLPGFWKKLYDTMGTKLHFSTAFHPQTDGQSERVIQILVGMLRACVIDFKGSWDKYIKSTEFAYNNSYQSSIGMAPFEPLHVSPWKKVLRSGKKDKLSFRFIDPHEIIDCIGPLAYRLALPPDLHKIHNVFHMSMLRKYRSDPSHVVAAKSISIQPDLTYEEKPVKILAREVKELRNKRVPLVKFLWRNHKTEKATWETEEIM
ncbi:uncharacterized protein LOC119371258 [Jatropha curcas]|uniref:uncharacterized protein LOC119371258 n=1 Tax=Jatropha curcas TaxID=180498 RepID=UPI001895F404|nr:uncharacterized protein LOC119371258 [Jatropha curcas]